MPTPTKVKLVGGQFQDAEGNLLSYGYLEMSLNQDGNISGVGQIASGITIKVLLDGNASIEGASSLTLSSVATASGGSAVYTGTISGGDNNAFSGLTFVVAGFANTANNGTFVCVGSTATTLTLANATAAAETHAGTATASQSVWGNDQMAPANAYYRITGFTKAGQPAWGPNNQQVNGNGGTFDVGTWVPNEVFSWVPPLQPLLLETDGVENAEQFRLNFEDTATVTWAVDGSGNLEATAIIPPPPTPLDIKTNSVDNTSQAVLNFEDTSSVTWSNPSGGIVKATAVQQGAVVATAGQGFLLSNNLMIPSLFGSVATATALVPASTGANQVYAIQFVLPFKITITKATMLNAASGSAKMSFGVYSADGTTKIVDSGVFNVASDNNGYTNTLSAATLSPGVYWFAWTCDTAGKNIQGINFSTTAAFFAQFFNLTTAHYGLSSNASSVGGLPSSLGTITAQNTVFSSAGIPVVLFEP